MSWRRRGITVVTVFLVSCVILSAAPSLRAAPLVRDGDTVSIGGGVGPEFGGAGLMVGYSAGRVNGFGIEFEFGFPLIPTLGLGFSWAVGSARFGFGIQAGVQPFGGKCTPVGRSSSNGPCIAAGLGGINFRVDADIGRKGGWFLRLGLGLALVGVGDVGIPLPFTMGVIWAQ